MIRYAASIVALLALTTTAAAKDARVDAPIVGAVGAQRAVLRGILASLGGTLIERIELVRLRDGRVRVDFQPREHRTPRTVRIEWDQGVVAMMFARASHERGLPRVAGYTGSLAQGRATGARLPVSGNRASFDRSAIVKPVGGAVRRSGARVIEFNLFRPLGRPVFAVVLSARRPARFIERRLAPIINAFPEGRLDAFYVAVTDARRRVVFAYSALGVSAFTYYVRPDLVGCAKRLPIANEVDPEGVAPPCPS
jgi:hypothetical protein